MARVPVILDTDIGFDVDDVWALALLLCTPELDVRLVLSSTGDTRYGAALAAKLLEIAGRSDVPVGVGLALEEHSGIDWLRLELLPLMLTDDAKTMESESGAVRPIRCAMSWHDKEAFLDWLVERYTAPVLAGSG